MKKTWKRVPLGPLQTNCYIYAKENGECLIFDPGEEAQKLIGIIREKGWKPAAILLTHAHFDHIGAVDAVRESFDIPVYLHKKEADWLSNPALNGSQYFQMGPIQAKEADELITEEGMQGFCPWSTCGASSVTDKQDTISRKISAIYAYR